MNLVALTNKLSAVCPIHGVNSNGVISFKDEATQQQRDAAQAYVTANLHRLDGPDAPPDPMVAVLADFRALREQVLNRMNGIRDDLQDADDTVGVTALRTARQALKDLPQYPTITVVTNQIELRLAIKARYAEISAALATASPAAYLAFRGLDA